MDEFFPAVGIFVCILLFMLGVMAMFGLMGVGPMEVLENGLR